MQLQVVSETLAALHLHQDGITLLGAEAHGQTVRPGAWPIIGSPGVRDECSSSPKNIRGPSCQMKKDIKRELNVQRCCMNQRRKVRMKVSKMWSNTAEGIQQCECVRQDGC